MKQRPETTVLLNVARFKVKIRERSKVKAFADSTLNDFPTCTTLLSRQRYAHLFVKVEQLWRASPAVGQ